MLLAITFFSLQFFHHQTKVILPIDDEEKEKKKEKQITRTFIDVTRRKTVYNLLSFFSLFGSRTKRVNEQIDESQT